MTAGSAEHAAAAAAKKKGGLDDVLAAIDGPKSISTVSFCNHVHAEHRLALKSTCMDVSGMWVFVVCIETTGGGLRNLKAVRLAGYACHCCQSIGQPDQNSWT